MRQRWPGSAAPGLVDGTRLSSPESQVFDAVRDGWAAQKAIRNLVVEGAKHSLSMVRRFQEYSGELPCVDAGAIRGTSTKPIK